MSEKYPCGYVVTWVKLFRMVNTIEGHRPSLMGCKKAFDRLHPDWVEWQRIKYEKVDDKMWNRWAWVENYKKLTGCTLSTAFEIHKELRGY